MLIKIYSAGQLLDRVQCKESNLKRKMLRIKRKLEKGKFKVEAGLGEVVTRELCLDIYSNNPNSDGFEMRSLKC
ncbi:MAG: hypothetical protein H6779_02740 [Candidatus Nomurabacteria bacterium]|nr:hypothetical protein [Candidatus Nomurabacteria bacterium]USN87306.1 MAG: hypothetical protein H6779_02740 [Candidatus Nomurabacteria bacterium]